MWVSILPGVGCHYANVLIPTDLKGYAPQYRDMLKISLKYYPLNPRARSKIQALLRPLNATIKYPSLKSVKHRKISVPHPSPSSDRGDGRPNTGILALKWQKLGQRDANHLAFEANFKISMTRG